MVSRCHCGFAAGWSPPWVLALNEGSPQEAHVIVGTVVEVLHRLSEAKKVREMQKCSKGHQQPSSKSDQLREYGRALSFSFSPLSLPPLSH